MRHSAGSFLALCLILLLTACAEAPPPPGPRVPVALSLGRIQVDLPVGHKAGAYGWRWDWSCVAPFNEVAWITEGRTPGLLTQAARDGVGLGGLGLTAGAARVLTGRLVDVELSLCRQRDALSQKPIGITGEGNVRIDWELTDPPEPVRRFTTVGEGETDIPSLNGQYDIILRNAAADAARRLAAMPEFRQLVMSPMGGEGPAAAGPVPALPVSSPGQPAAFVETVEADETPEPEPAMQVATPVAPGAARVQMGANAGVIVDPRGWVLLPDTSADLADPLPLLLADGQVVTGQLAARAFGFLLVRLPEGNWPALAIRRQRPAVSQWLHRLDGEGRGPVAMVAAHTGPVRAQATEIPSLLLDLDEELWRNPPWILLDEEGRLAALRGAKALPGDPAPYYAPSPVMAHFRTIMGDMGN
ncbi:hypothetical protein IP70_04970 [alpha proteobacterium AAP38]|nr:hypothetical protein IP70_04970 [alpha proteobacterium AAP38]